MHGILILQGFIGLVVFFVTLAIKAWAFIDSVLHSSEEYRAADKWSKKGWVILLGVGLACMFLPIGVILGNLTFLVSIGLLVAAIVYLVDVRPAIRALYRRR